MPADQTHVSQAVAQSAKSAIRGNRQAHLRQCPQAVRGRIEKGAKDARTCELEFPP